MPASSCRHWSGVIPRITYLRVRSGVADPSDYVIKQPDSFVDPLVEAAGRQAGRRAQHDADLEDAARDPVQHLLKVSPLCGQVLIEDGSRLLALRGLGVLWPVVHQQLGVDPQLGNGLLQVLPSVPNAGRQVLVSTPCSGQTWKVHIVAT